MTEESFLLGLQAYKEKQYARAIALLSDVDSEQWDAQLYLGMSLYMVGRAEDALKHFARMRNTCTDASIRQKADTAYLMVSSKLRQTAQLKKEEDELTIEW